MRLIEREASDRLIGLDIREASGVPSTAACRANQRTADVGH
jgi:hypothetical protein